MITCQHARHLFDRYLDGELSSSLQAELHAHQLSCSMCQSELAMLEACGDVVALDRCEPKLSASFTDRVLQARRAQMVRPPRHWGRKLLLVGSPMAAAASIMFAFMLMAPSAQRNSRSLTAVHMDAEKPPGFVLQVLGGGKNLSKEAKLELDNTRQMSPGGFVETLLGKLIEESEGTVQGARGSLAELEELWRQGLSGASEKWVAQWRSAARKGTASDAPVDPPIGGPEFMAPPNLNSEPSSDTPTDVPVPLLPPV